MQTATHPREPLRAPRAAGMAGVVFALLLAAAMVLIRLAIPQGADAVTVQHPDPGRREAVRTALLLVPFAGIFFLWFVGAVRSHVGDAEDRFIATVFLGSGLVFTAMIFAAAAVASAVLDTAHPAGTSPSRPTWDFGQHLAYTLLTGYAMRMAAVFTCSTSVIGHRLRILPRWLTLVGFLTTVVLLFVSSAVPWAELVFPAWSLLLSVYIVVASFRRSAAAPAV
ncbi:hypothetical protein ACWDE0_16920 [Streptomyces sp. 900105755]|uniref:hypothetical protein n=1 Tax=unclassified Streptomyces TaxID=2593676 RepID=UPI000897EF86|nr:hypothetical protein [Streptomyces sp. Ag109_O5-10]SEF15115.1 hypothetical protein SAMN05216533_7286 [Streptomyces sp. Ag109_O5-10]